MTQLYVGNLSAEGDEKSIRMLFGKYGQVREVLMKSGYAFVEFESPISAEESMRELNGSDILGHPMIVEPSHQQRLSSRRKIQHGKVEVSDIPAHYTIQNVESYLSQFGTVLKMEIEETEFGVKKIVVTYETQGEAQRAATWDGPDQAPRVMYIDTSMNGLRSTITTRKGSPGIPTAQSSKNNNTDFPLRILVPSDMVGAIIGKDGATIRMITQLTKARVDVHRRENLGTAEKAITTIGPPECCTEACYQIMKIMQNELLMTNGMMESGKFHEPLPVVPLKILAHNELVGRVIGKGGGTLKRIMAESGTKITISKLKDLTAFNMERTITILGTIDNCKKAESLISAKLRASYESDMAQFIPELSALSPSPTNIPTPPGQTPNLGGLSTTMADFTSRPAAAQSLPATPSAANVRTFTDYSGEHTRLTTLHGSTGALEVNNLGGFKLGSSSSLTNGSSSKFASALESSIDGIVRTNDFNDSLNGGVRTTSRSHLGLAVPSKHITTTVVGGNGGGGVVNVGGMGINMVPNGGTGMGGNAGGGNGGIGNQFHHHHHQPGGPGAAAMIQGLHASTDDDMADVFTGLSFKEPSVVAAPGYGRSRPRRSSAPVVTNGDHAGFGGGVIGAHYGLWGNAASSENPLPEVPRVASTGDFSTIVPTSRNSPVQSFSSSTHNNGGSFSAGLEPHQGFSAAWTQANGAPVGGNSNGGGGVPITKQIWSQGGGGGGGGPMGNGNSRPGSQNSSDSSSFQSSPIYSPTSSTGFGGFSAASSSAGGDTGGVPSLGLLTTAPLNMGGLGGPVDDRNDSRSPFRASVPTPLTTVAETITTNGNHPEEDDFYPSFVNDLLGDTNMVPPISVGFQW